MTKWNQLLILPNSVLMHNLAPAFTNSWSYKIILAFIGTLILTLSAKIQVPFYPVPMTMQTFVVLVIAMSLGLKLGGLTVLLYLFEGALGLPVFAGTPAKGIGIAYMIGPTGGYLVGFLVAAFVVGYLAEHGLGRNIISTFFTIFIGTLLIFLCGYVWLSTLIGLEKAFLFGVLPFVWGEIFKMALATVLLPMCWKWFGRKS